MFFELKECYAESLKPSSSSQIAISDIDKI